MSDERKQEEPEQLPTEGDAANDNGPPAYAKELQDQSYPNRNMTAEERPEIPESGIEESPEVDPRQESDE